MPLAASGAFHGSPCQMNPSCPASGEAQVEVSVLVKAAWDGCLLSLPKDGSWAGNSPCLFLTSWVHLWFAHEFPMGGTFSMKWEFGADSWLELVSCVGYGEVVLSNLSGSLLTFTPENPSLVEPRKVPE